MFEVTVVRVEELVRSKTSTCKFKTRLTVRRHTLLNTE